MPPHKTTLTKTLTNILDKYIFGAKMIINNNKGEHMFKALKMRIAARRMEKTKSARKSAKKSTRQARKQSSWAKVVDVVKKPFIILARWLRSFWSWVRSIDLIGLVNITLLSAIIVLFSMLIIDIIGCNKKPVVIIAKNDIAEKEQFLTSDNSASRAIRERAPQKVASLPIHRDANRQYTQEPINVVKVKPDDVAIKQTARVRNVMYGDVIIDSRGAATMLKTGDIIKGNLFLQNMRKYTLPRGIRIEGNLFLRDMGMLQFAGEFTVTGNIYVTPTSSFGPLPGTARIGGQVIL